MKKIFQLILLVLLIYVAVQELPPLIDKVSDLGSGLSRTSTSVGAGRCVTAAETASETFTHNLRQFSSPPIDLVAWADFKEGLEEHLYEAESECACPRASCQRATEALSELDQLVLEFDGSLHGGGVPLNPARRQETIQRLLKRARELDRQGD